MPLYPTLVFFAVAFGVEVAAGCDPEETYHNAIALTQESGYMKASRHRLCSLSSDNWVKKAPCIRLDMTTHVFTRNEYELPNGLVNSSRSNLSRLRGKPVILVWVGLSNQTIASNLWVVKFSSGKKIRKSCSDNSQRN